MKKWQLIGLDRNYNIPVGKYHLDIYVFFLHPIALENSHVFLKSVKKVAPRKKRQL